MDLVVLFYGGQGFVVEYHGMLFSICRRLLRQNCSYSEVRAVHFNPERLQVLEEH